MDSDYSCNSTSPEAKELAMTTANDLLPKQSRENYEKQYFEFQTWCSDKRVKLNKISENVMLAYFKLLSEKYKSSTLWSIYSKLKSTIQLHHDVDLSKFVKLKLLLKQKNVGYKAKKSKIFSKEELTKFFAEAPDKQYLLIKVNNTYSNYY